MNQVADIWTDTSLHVIYKEDLEKSAKLMASAFDGDPSIRYLLGGTLKGVNDWQYFYTILKSIYGKAMLFSLDKEINELLILLPPKFKGVPTIAFLRNGGVHLPSFFKKGLLSRSWNYESNCKKVKKQFADKNTWYCLGFVVTPTLQKQGRGSALIKSVLKILKNNNYSLYLETHNEINIAIYEHLGFRLKDISFIPKTQIKQYAMLWKSAYQTE